MQHRLNCLTVFLAFLAALFFPAVAQAQGPCPGESLEPKREGVFYLWTGPEKGYYFQVGRAIAAASKHMTDEPRIQSCISKGSESNLKALHEGRADFAIVQSDAAHKLWHCEGAEAAHCASEGWSSRIRLVTPLFMEKAQVLLRPHLYLSSLAELRASHCIWTGGGGSGSEATARLLLEAAGWSREQIAAAQSGCHHVPNNLEEALASLRKGEDLDAIIQTRVAPASQIQEAFENYEIQLLGIDWATVQRMTKDGIYRETSIQRSEYPSVREAVYSIGVPALLLTSTKTDGDAVRAMAELIQDHQADIEHHLRRNLLAEGGARGDADSDAPKMIDGSLVGPTTLTLVGSKVPEGLMAYADPEAKPYLWRWSVRRSTFIRLAMLLGLLLVIGIFLRVHSSGRKLVSGYPRELLFVFGGVLVWTSAALWLQATEGDLNEHFTTLASSALALGENVLAKLPLPITFAPAPTTRSGAALVSIFSYVVASLATIYFLPWLRRFWQWLKPGLFDLEDAPRQPGEPGKPGLAASPSEGAPKRQEVLTRVAGV